MKTEQRETGLRGSESRWGWGVVARVSLGAAAVATGLGCVLRVLGPVVRAAAEVARLPTGESVRLFTLLLAGG